MGSKGITWGAQVNKQLDSELENYKEDTGLSKSETVRDLLEKGLASEKGSKIDWKMELFDYVSTIGAVFTALLIISVLGYLFTDVIQSNGFIFTLAVFTFIANTVPLVLLKQY